MNKTILLFGFEDLGTILSLQKAMAPRGIDVKPVGRSDCHQTIGALAGLDAPAAVPTAPAVMGQMAVLCVPMAQVQELLPLLNAAGAAGVLKAVLTPNNRSWSAAALYRELQREHREMMKGR